MKSLRLLLPILLLSAIAYSQTTTTAPAPTTLPLSARKRIEAQLSRVEGKNLIIRLYAPNTSITMQPRPTGEQEFLVELNDKTSIFIDTEKAKLEDLKPGMKVTLQTFNTPDAVTVLGESPHRTGIFLKLEGKELNLNYLGNPSTIAVDENTKVTFLDEFTNGQLVKGGPRTLADLEPNMVLQIIPDTGTATKIIATHAPSGRPNFPARGPIPRPPARGDLPAPPAPAEGN